MTDVEGATKGKIYFTDSLIHIIMFRRRSRVHFSVGSASKYNINVISMHDSQSVTYELLSLHLQPKSGSTSQQTAASHHGSANSAYCANPCTLVLIIFASICCTPLGWFARRYYAQVAIYAYHKQPNTKPCNSCILAVLPYYCPSYPGLPIIFNITYKHAKGLASWDFPRLTDLFNIYTDFQHATLINWE